MIALSRKGFSVTGFDPSSELVEAGQRNLAEAGVAADLLLGEPCCAPANLGVHDGLIIGRGAYHHIPGRDARIKFLRACCAHVKDQGLVLIGSF